jgi:hypothetical protein
VFENLLEISNLVDVNETCMIPFHFHVKEEMQIIKIFHFELSRKFFLHLQKLIFIIAKQNEIIDINDNENFDIFNFYNVHTEIYVILHKLEVFKKTSSFRFQTLGDYFKPYNDL